MFYSDFLGMNFLVLSWKLTGACPRSGLSPGTRVERVIEGQGPREEMLGTYEGQAPESSCLGLTLDRELTASQGPATCPIPGRGNKDP